MNRDLILLHLSLIDGIGPVTIQALCKNNLPKSEFLQNGFSQNEFLQNEFLQEQDKLAQSNLLCKKLENFELQDLYCLQRIDFVNMFGLSQAVAGKVFFGLKDIGLLEKEVGLMTANNVNFVTIESKNYPQMLKEIYAPPAVLHIKSEFTGVSSSAGMGKDIGWETVLNFEKKIAFVGSRKANNYGEKIIENIVPPMVQDGWVIVSGGAIGADTMAHQKTVQLRGKAIAVIGSGLLNTYPSSNEKLFRDILANGGLIVSPFGMQTVARPGNFPARNRVIAGISLGCVVVQAAKKSGASITAQFSLDQGREVFAVPGLIYDELSLGCHELISQGAKLVSCAEDILIEFPELVSGKKASTKQLELQTVLQKQASEKLEQPVCDKLVLPENKQEQVQEDGQKTEKIIENLKVKIKKSQTSTSGQSVGQKGVSEKQVSKYKSDTLEFEIIRICARACSLDQIAIATNKSMHDLHEVLFDMQINGDIKQNYAGMFELA